MNAEAAYRIASTAMSLWWVVWINSVFAVGGFVISLRQRFGDLLDTDAGTLSLAAMAFGAGNVVVAVLAIKALNREAARLDPATYGHRDSAAR
jgi:hypothetical protein